MRRHLYNKLLENGKSDCLFLKTVWGLIKLIESCCFSSGNGAVDRIVNSGAKEELFFHALLLDDITELELAGILCDGFNLCISWFLLSSEIPPPPYGFNYL